VFVIAVKEFLKKLESKKLLDLLNEIYSDIETPEDVTLRRKAMRHYARKVLKGPY
jgi:hypothetical protein